MTFALLLSRIIVSLSALLSL